MNINSDNFRYKKIIKIEEVGKALRGSILKFYFGSAQFNEPEILNGGDIIDYYNNMGDPVKGFVKEINVGDYLIEHK